MNTPLASGPVTVPIEEEPSPQKITAVGLVVTARGLGSVKVATGSVNGTPGIAVILIAWTWKADWLRIAVAFATADWPLGLR